MIYIDQIKIKSKTRKISFDKRYPTDESTFLDTPITYIEIFDMYIAGKGGCVYVKDGGIGYNFVILHFSGQKKNGIFFIVNIFGEWLLNEDLSTEYSQ